MVFGPKKMSAAALAIVLFAAGGNAETVQHRAKHGKAATHNEKTGRTITVHNQTPSWLTLGPNARAQGSNSYATDTFNQPSPVQGTFTGYRGRERLIDQYGVPSAPLFRF